MPSIPRSLLGMPITHRGMHDMVNGVQENSRAAFLAAIKAGYGIELDLQLSSDGEAMVFHDYSLDRLTNKTGPIRMRAAAELRETKLKAGDCILDLEELLQLVNGRVPLLIELKDQDGALGPDVGSLERRAAELLATYSGDVAVMSFNPHSIKLMSELAPKVPRGLTTCNFLAESWSILPQKRAEELNTIPDFDRVGGSFISHEWQVLDAAPVAALRAKDVPVLCWTVQSAAQEIKARRLADNITFEGYIPAKRK